MTTKLALWISFLLKPNQTLTIALSQHKTQLFLTDLYILESWNALLQPPDGANCRSFLPTSVLDLYWHFLWGGVILMCILYRAGISIFLFSNNVLQEICFWISTFRLFPTYFHALWMHMPERWILCLCGGHVMNSASKRPLFSHPNSKVTAPVCDPHSKHFTQ